jgi:hypothetical protein
MIKISYVLDNDNWSDSEYEDNQDIEREILITKEMLIDLIERNVTLEPGTFIDTLYITKL